MPLECPICQKPVPPRADNRGFPFCSVRCKAIDLGKWLGEEYRVPDRHADAVEDEIPRVGGDRDLEDESA